MKYFAPLVSGLALFALLLLSLPAMAGQLSLTLYNDGRFLVRDLRSMQVPAHGEMLFTGVPETIRPDTLSVASVTAPKKFQLLETGYSFRRMQAAALLDRYQGRELTVILPDPADVNARIQRKAVLLSAQGTPVFEIDGKVYVGTYDAIVLPSLPGELDRSPTLHWLVRNQGPKQQNLDVSYLANGLGWRADYAMVFDARQKTVALTAWASIDNKSGTAFTDAKVKLVAGEVGRAPARERNMMYKAAPVAMAVDAEMGGTQVHGVGEYHVYTLPRPVTLLRGETRQVRLFSAPAVPVETELVSLFGVGMYNAAGERTTQAVNAFVKLKNDKAKGLGLPMPAGVVRMYQKDTDGAALLVGEDGIGHVAPGNEARLRMGTPFDITVERVQTAYRKTGKHSATMTWKITVKNGSDRKRIVRLHEQFHGQWKISGATEKYRKLSSGLVEFEVSLPAGVGSTTLQYTVHLS